MNDPGDSDDKFDLAAASSGVLAADWPGKWYSVIALLGDRRVLYFGLPTAGAPARYTHLGSRGPQQLVTVKVAEINSDRFQTVVPYIDARYPISFGAGKKP